MKAFILAAGLGTRLRPWTLHHPKALVPVKGEPMLGRVIKNLKGRGVDEIVVNVHHFADQIEKYLSENDFGVRVHISDEREELLDTGGALLKAEHLLESQSGDVLVHNVDILSNADIEKLIKIHKESANEVTLLVSERESSRKLIFDRDMQLRGWHNLSEQRFRPADYRASEGDMELAFSGIYVIGKGAIEEMKKIMTEKKFSVIDYFLSGERGVRIGCFNQHDLELLDIGKPSTLEKAERLLMM